MRQAHEKTNGTVSEAQYGAKSTRRLRCGVRAAGAVSTAALVASFALAGFAYADGTVRCWGYNDFGQCNVPADLGSVKALGRGSSSGHTAVIDSGLNLRGWGFQNSCADDFPKVAGPLLDIELGTGFTENLGLGWIRTDSKAGYNCWNGGYAFGVAEIACFEAVLLVRLEGGTVVYAGPNYLPLVANVPVDASPSRAIAAGQERGISLRLDGTVVGWGLNDIGQCDVPANLGTTSAIAAGVIHSLALDINGAVRCWGDNGAGLCNVPTDLSPVVAIAAGSFHSVALQQNGTVRCWGGNYFGQCNVPTDLGAVTAISAGRDHTIALTCGLEVDNHLSPNLGAFGFGAGKQHTFTNLPAISAAPVTVTVWARGDLNLASEFLTISADGGVLGAAFNTVGTAQDCDPSVVGSLYRAAFTLTPKQYAALAVDGAITVRAEPSLGVSATQCSDTALYLQIDTTRPYADCNENGRNDACDIDLNPLLDCNQNGVLDSCEGAGGGGDCNANGISDECEIVANPVLDCDANGAIDACEITADPSLDCNGNGRIDTCEVAGLGGSADCDNDNLIDTCEIAANPSLDCNNNGRLDTCDIWELGLQDKDSDGRPDSCEFARGDFDLDGQVGAADLGGLLAIWGLQNPPYGDLDGDGIVGGGDMSTLLSNWGTIEY
jgi:hypothetical protein